jgi:hypothetical protein
MTAENTPTTNASDSGGTGNDAESVYRANLEAFGGRAARLCGLLRRGSLSREKCFLALCQLWDQVLRDQRRSERSRRVGSDSDGGDRGSGE